MRQQRPVPLTKTDVTGTDVSLTKGASPSTADEGIRASDADRDRIADVLRDALAEGRLTAEEHAERVDAVYRARTVGELAPLVRDLPVAGASVAQSRAPAEAEVRAEAPVPAYDPARAGDPAENLVAVFSAAVRKGRWRPGRRTRAVGFFGSVEIDLTEALFEQPTVVIDAVSVFGSVEIRVPENVTLRGSGSGVFGAFEVDTRESAQSAAPEVVVSGFSLFGSVEARHAEGKWLRDLRAGGHGGA